MWNLSKGDYALPDSHLGASAGHAVNDAAGLILSEGNTAATVNGLNSLGSIQPIPVMIIPMVRLPKTEAADSIMTSMEGTCR